MTNTIKPSIVGIDHIVLRTADLEAMLGFYRDVLGCEVERELAPEVGLVQLRAGESIIDLVPVDSELGRLGGGPPQQEGRNMEHFCLLVADGSPESLGRHLADCGIPHEPFQERYGATGFGLSTYLKDPEGNTLELKLSAA